MDKERMKKLLRLYGWQVLVVIVGLVLVFSPDTASALIAKVIGWILIAIGVLLAIGAILGGGDRTRLIVGAVLCLGVGIFVSSFPMVLAEALGRFFGLFLAISGISNVRKALQKKEAELPYQYSLVIALLTLVAGVVLMLLPLTLSRIILNICGVVLVVIGVVNIIGAYQERKMLEDGSRPDIIDADV